MCVLSYKYKESTHFDFCLVKRVQRITVLRYTSVTPLALLTNWLFASYSFVMGEWHVLSCLCSKQSIMHESERSKHYRVCGDMLLCCVHPHNRIRFNHISQNTDLFFFPMTLPNKQNENVEVQAVHGHWTFVHCSCCFVVVGDKDPICLTQHFIDRVALKYWVLFTGQSQMGTITFKSVTDIFHYFKFWKWIQFLLSIVILCNWMLLQDYFLWFYIYLGPVIFF